MKNFTEFNKQADQYARFRPNYPKELYQYLKQLCPHTKTALDVGTGNGQCAIDLADHFDKVFASDLSAEQIANAIPNKKIKYFVAPASESKLEAESVDLVTVATAIHWFKFDEFYSEVNRVLNKDGIIAVWAYGWHECENSEITYIFEEIGQKLLLPFWSDPPKLIWSGYKTIPFPFIELETPRFEIQTDWNLAQFIGYVSTWSASQKFIDQFGHHPAQSHFEGLVKAWGDTERTLKFKSPLYLRVGRKL